MMSFSLQNEMVLVTTHFVCMVTKLEWERGNRTACFDLGRGKFCTPRFHYEFVWEASQQRIPML